MMILINLFALIGFITVLLICGYAGVSLQNLYHDVKTIKTLVPMQFDSLINRINQLETKKK